MVKKITWSPLAIETFDALVEYILNKFGEKTVNKLIRTVDQRIQLICSRPEMFRRSAKKRNTYITTIHQNLTLTYRYLPGKKQVELVVFWGMQDPKKKPE